MSAILALAGNTFRELTRNKLLYLLGVFSMVLILSSLFLMEISLGQWDRVLKDVSFAVIHLSGACVAILVGGGLIANELERRTVYVTLSKPITRAQFVLGKYLGLCLVMLILVGAMGGILCGLLYVIRVPPGVSTYGALLLIYVELCVLAAFAMIFSAFTTQTLGVIFSASVFVIGHLSEDLRVFALRVKGFQGFLITWLSYLLPNFEQLNLKTQAANNLPVDIRYVFASAGYGLLYAPIALLVAMFIFTRRDFK